VKPHCSVKHISKDIALVQNVNFPAALIDWLRFFSGSIIKVEDFKRRLLELKKKPSSLASDEGQPL
jgi:hypothetical protein